MNPADAFSLVYEHPPRQGPGSPDTTARALWLVPELPARPRILDLGCGSGGQTLTLADLLPDAQITAMDERASLLQRLERDAHQQGVADRITVVEGDFARPPDGPWDLVWSEGAAYALGFERAVQTWSALLVPGGSLALSEVVWTTSDPAPEIRDFWADEYSAMASLGAREQALREAGLTLMESFRFPESDWWDRYYQPLADHVASLRDEASPVLAEVLDMADREVDMRRRHADAYAYSFLVGHLAQD